MKSLICAAAAALLVCGASAASAQTVRSAEHNQHQRIEQGERSGSLTWRESRRLDRREARLRREVRYMRAHNDGRLTPSQRRWVRRQERANSRAIRRLKHNDRRD